MQHGWHWVPDLDGEARLAYDDAGGDSRFPSQGEAEAWLAESWEGLADLGVTEVSLHEGDRLVYGPMALAGG